MTEDDGARPSRRRANLLGSALLLSSAPCSKASRRNFRDPPLGIRRQQAASGRALCAARCGAVCPAGRGPRAGLCHLASVI